MTDPITQSMIQGAAGAGGDKVYAEDLFSPYNYQGAANKSLKTYVDMSEGGLIWVKCTNTTSNHFFIDTVRGGTKALYSNGNDTEYTMSTNGDSSFSGVNFVSTGVTVGGEGGINTNGSEYISYNFKKAPGFLDIVTWTGNGTSGRTIPHELGCIPGFIIVKSRSHAEAWAGYHTSFNGGGANAGQWSININTTNGAGANAAVWNNTNPTATHFTVGDDGQTNRNAYTYVAYVFAGAGDADSEIFGEDGDQSMIKCGTYNGSQGDLVVDIGFEPQWLMIKRMNANGYDWMVMDKISGFGPWRDSSLGDAAALDANNTYGQLGQASGVTGVRCATAVKGFQFVSESQADVNVNGGEYLYVAIRDTDAKVTKPAEVGTDIFQLGASTGVNAIPPGNFNTGIVGAKQWPVDMAFLTSSNSDMDRRFSTRKITRIAQNFYWSGNETAKLSSNNDYRMSSPAGWAWGWGNTYNSWMWKKSQGFTSMVYRGTGSAQAVDHNLGKTPEMMWIKNCVTADWNPIYHKGFNNGTNPAHYYGQMNTSTATTAPASSVWNNTAPTATQFTVGNNQAVNWNSEHFVAMLFASVDGFSKVGYYTGNSTADRVITTGFTPRFLLIRRADATDNWCVIDSVMGNTKQLRINVTTAPITTAVQITFVSTGFQISSSGNGPYNTSTEKYIYYAHA